MIEYNALYEKMSVWNIPGIGMSIFYMRFDVTIFGIEISTVFFFFL